MADKRIPWNSHEFTPEIVAGIVPDGMNEFIHPDYPDLPYPDEITDITWYQDPLVNNDEPNPDPDLDWLPDSDNPWLYPYGPHCPPTT
ncbi:MAG: hypothetical protein GX060_06605 [Firmicutes bacterium]|nr:hypothetical protein [Bacillota bacterium]